MRDRRGGSSTSASGFALCARRPGLSLWPPQPSAAAKRAPGRGVGAEGAGAGPRSLLGTYGQGATWTTQRHLGGAESTNAEGRLVAVPRAGQQHVLRRGAVPIDDQVASREVTADEGVVPKAGAELVAAAGVEGTADLRGALPHERREVADIPSMLGVRVVGWGSRLGRSWGWGRDWGCRQGCLGPHLPLMLRCACQS